MLDGIDDIDWARLGHAYGSAKDVPEQIRALASPDPQAREKALHDLYGNIFHQGTRYEATAYAVPFLLELLADPGTPGRAQIAGLCGAIAIGYDSSWLPGNLPIAEQRAAAEGGEAVLATVPTPRDEFSDDAESDAESDSASDGEFNSEFDGDEDFDEDDEGEEEYSFAHLSEEDENKLYAYLAVRAYDAVRAGVPVFLDLLNQPGDELRTMAAYALAWFPEDAQAILPHLMESGFDDEVTQATALVSIGLLGGRPDPAALRDPRPLVRWGAAVARGVGPKGWEAGETLRDSEELVAWVTGSAATDERIPFLDGDLGGLASLALARLGTDAAFDALLARIPMVGGVAALPPVSAALRLAFPDGPHRAGAPLDDRQRRLVQTLADSPGTWLYDGLTFGNFTGLVGYYGLPRSREALRTWLDGEPD